MLGLGAFDRINSLEGAVQRVYPIGSGDYCCDLTSSHRPPPPAPPSTRSNPFKRSRFLTKIGRTWGNKKNQPKIDRLFRTEFDCKGRGSGWMIKSQSYWLDKLSWGMGGAESSSYYPIGPADRIIGYTLGGAQKVYLLSYFPIILLAQPLWTLGGAQSLSYYPIGSGDFWSDPPEFILLSYYPIILLVLGETFDRIYFPEGGAPESISYYPTILSGLGTFDRINFLDPPPPKKKIMPLSYWVWRLLIG